MWPMRKKWWLYLIIKHCSKSDLRDISHCNQRLKAHQHTNVTSHHTCYVCALIAVTVQPVPRLAHTSVGCHQQNCHHQCQRNDILCAYLHKVLALLRFFFVFACASNIPHVIPRVHRYAARTLFFHHRFALQFHPLIAQLLLNHPSNSDCRTKMHAHTHINTYRHKYSYTHP